MIRLTRLNGSRFVINGILIEMVEATPDTVITLSIGKKIIVKESVDEVIDAVTNFYRKVGLIGQSVAIKAEDSDEE